VEFVTSCYCCLQNLISLSNLTQKLYLHRMQTFELCKFKVRDIWQSFAVKLAYNLVVLTESFTLGVLTVAAGIFTVAVSECNTLFCWFLFNMLVTRQDLGHDQPQQSTPPITHDWVALCLNPQSSSINLPMTFWLMWRICQHSGSQCQSALFVFV